MDVLRFATAGSVDDGKSSLIGRLLYDTKSIYEDQFASIERASIQRGSREVELALLTDGLRAEREQNITIDVAYRYFSTPKRKFIIADTPGHVQYTRNMVTGTSNADVSVVLVDATKGVLAQSRRHAAVSALLRVPKLVVAINKMDLVGYDQARFQALATEFGEAILKLGVAEAVFIPISALQGDNVVDRGENMPWYTGPTLLEYLEQVEPPVREVAKPFRMPVQLVLRAGDGHRALAGTVSSGAIEVGQRLTVLPSGLNATVSAIRVAGDLRDSAIAGEPLAIELGENVDVSRGAMLVEPSALPAATSSLEGVLCWLGDRPLVPGALLILQHTTRRVGATVEAILSAVDVETLDHESAKTLEKNDLGRVRIRLSEPIFAETFLDHRELGSFVLIDRGDFVTVAAGMIEAIHGEQTSHQGEILWCVGDPSLELSRLSERGISATVLGAEDLSDLNADDPSTEERLRRTRAVARLLARNGVVIVPISSAAEVTWELADGERLVDGGGE